MPKSRGCQPEFSTANFLHVAYLGYSFQVEKASDRPALNLLNNIAVLGLSGSDFTGDGKVQLADFLFYGHSLYQRIDKAVRNLEGISAPASWQRQKRLPATGLFF